MNMLQVPMYRANEARRQLMDFLRKVPENDWAWSLFEFDGVGRMPADQPLRAFQGRLEKQPNGLIFTWTEIREFADALEYTIDCLLVAVTHVDLLAVEKLLADDFRECEVVIRAIDSTEWVLCASDDAVLSDMARA